jgi:signal transduction histidine kinase
MPQMEVVPTQLERAIAAGGETGMLVRRLDWSRTPLGPMNDWPTRLQVAVSMCLSTGFPMALNWGPELIQIYNDAAIPVFASKHPAAMGRSARTNFPEFWDFSQAESLVEGVFRTALPFRAEDQRLLVNRHGLLEEAYFTFSLSPMLDGEGAVLGILNTYVETTARVLAERRMGTLRTLAERAMHARTTSEACEEMMVALSANPYDLRLVLLYLVDSDVSSATLTCSAGIAAHGPAAPGTLVMHPPGDGFTWPIEEVLRTRQAVIVEDLLAKVDLGPRSGRTSPPRTAVVFPLVRSSDAAPAGILVAGLSPRLPFDEAYRGFLELVASQVAAGIASAEAYDETRRRAERLAEIDRAKNIFYTNISHEFRTPLTLILAPVDDLLREEVGPLTAPQRDTLLALRRSALRLRRLVSGLLDLSRVEAGRFEPQPEALDLASLTREIAGAFEPAMRSAGLRFVVECPPLPRLARMDRSVWETIVPNLLSNALKYTTHGSVTLRLEAIDGRVRLTVQDTGAGIAPAALAHVFERFYRAPGAEARSIEGTGIGLALVRELVGALGGEVGVMSKPGAGSTFTVELPFDAAVTAPATAGAEGAATSCAGTTALLQDAASWVERRSPTSEERPPPEPSLGRRRVLVVEDNADMRQYLLQVLRRDYEVRAVADGHAAVEAVAVSPPDLVVSDVVMPGLDGLALVRALRAAPSTCAIPVILVTSRAGEDAVIEGLGSRADDYVVKPFSSRELLARVHTHLELARIRREAAETATKDAFIGVVSHELRTPLTIIKFQAQLLAGQAAKGARLKGAGFDVLRRGVARMERLVDDLLSLSAIKSGTFTVHPERTDLATICRSAAQEQSVIAKRDVLLDLPPKEVFADIDAERVQQAVGNLLSNALRYSPPDRPVTLRLRGHGTEAVVSVRDEGPGIPPEALPRLFERFYRAPGVEVSAGSGTGLGLGLYVSRAIVEQHGGRIEIESQRGRGSTFSIHLPLARDSTEPRVAT